MEPEEDEEPEPYGSPSTERVWLHPSEMGSLLPPLREPERAGGTRAERARRSSARRALAVPVLSGVVGAALSLGIMVLAGGLDDATPDRVVERVADRPVFDIGEPEGVARLAAAVSPSIVGLRATGPDGERVGSGVVFRSDGHVLTNHHLVDGATSIEITAADGQSWVAHHAGSDPDSDLAVVGCRGATMEPAVLGSAEYLRVGETAVVVGAPGGPQGSPTVTAGVIAGLGEVVEVGGRPLYDVISTDAMIGSRASGGALVDRSGVVVGIAIKVMPTETGDDRLGLVIPIDLARRVADELIRHGRVTYPWIGVAATDLDPWTAKEYGVAQGTLVRRVEPKSPAERSGIQVQDVVTAVERSPISTLNELMMLVRRHEPGDDVDVTVVRSGKPRTVRVHLGAGPAGP
ncbi:MAG TPA: trypsin-like peptidase domain-containing protein [Acidimicrobiia bacterium]|nr:trypsin-like peptidase domain-containing protein [Acidimicrobiia bacterium]